MTPVTAAAPQLLANSQVYFLQGTKIGDTTSHPAPYVFTEEMMTGAGETVPAQTDFHFVDYPATIAPFSHGGLRDPTWGVSVDRGVAALGEQPVSGDTVFGYSQGAVVAGIYKRDHVGNGVNFVLVENPERPNGGIFERFRGLYVPLLNITFDGATPVVDPVPGGGTTVDIARQYDGWADFPKYPLNLLATANAVLGIIYLHGDTQDLDDDAVEDIDKSDPRYYQQHGDTTYYLIPTKRLPLLMPLERVLPKPVLDRLDAPLRAIVETGYDRSDYSKSTPAQLLPSPTPPAAAPAVTVKEQEAPETGSHQTTKTEPAPKPTKNPLPAKLRQSAAGISSTLRSLTHPTRPKPDPGTKKTEPTAPEPKSTEPKSAEPNSSEPKKSDPE